ncbi:hypothetical protein C2E23DRAFT_378040 [Lenzites betulinus]|nr:hypothetical protein C2E23DRAFT_378040 [Lenzites betulinus]
MAAPSDISLRRSSRLQAKATLVYADSEDEDHASAGPSTGSGSGRRPPAKRPRKSAPADLGGGNWSGKAKALGPKSRRRILSKLVDMPLDILFEIFGHLHPHDLLNLSRTTKALRNVLMQRSAISVWRHAREGVEDLPECPPDLTEPAYANLLFDHHCHFCVKARVMTTLWTCRSRACKSCLKEHFVQLFDVLVSARQYMPARLDGHHPIKTSSMVPMEYHYNKLLIPKKDSEELIASIKECEGDETALKELEKERCLAIEDLKDSAAKLSEWQIKQNHQRTMDLIDLRVRRRKQIIERLCMLGYGEDLKWMTYDRVDQFIEHPLVKQPKELTDRIWNNIREPMLAFAEEARTERLMYQRCVHYTDRLNFVRNTVAYFLAQRPLWDVSPSVADFSYYTAGFRAMLDAVPTAHFQALDIPDDQLDTILRGAMDEWRVTMLMTLYNMVESAKQPSSGTPALSVSSASISATAPAAASASSASTSASASSSTSASTAASVPGPASTSSTVSAAGSSADSAPAAAPTAPGLTIVKIDVLTAKIAILQSTHPGTASMPFPPPNPAQFCERILSARAWFRCTSPECGALLAYPRVLAHRCARAAPPAELHPQTARADLRNAYALELAELPWNFDGGAVVYDLDAERAAEAVVRACGRDPAHTEERDMRKLKARLVCGTCSKGGQACVMGWRRAVEHMRDHLRKGETGAKVTRLSKRDARIVREREGRGLIGYYTSVYKMWGCLRCRAGPAMTLVEVFEHCSEEHFIDMPEEEEDYDMHPDADATPDEPAHDIYYDSSLFLTPIRR